MKTIFNKIFNWLRLGIIILMLILVMLLAFLRFANPYFVAHIHDIEKFVGKLIQQPVSIRTVVTGNRGLEPALKLYDVAIFNNEKTRILLQVSELNVSIDLIGSLLKWGIKPGLIAVRGVDFLVYQNKAGHFFISGINNAVNGSATNSNLGFEEILGWFLEQSKIDLSDITLRWRQTNGEILRFTNLQLKLYNGVLQHDLQMHGKFMQKKIPAKFDIDLKLRGDILKQKISSVTGNVAIENWSVVWPKEFFHNHNAIIVNSGDINLLIKRPRITSELFRQPFAIDNVEGRITWQDTSTGLEVHINKFKCKDAWLALRGNMQILFPQTMQSPVVDMQFDFRLTDIAKAKLYYPAILMPPDGLAWLDQAFLSGKLMDGNIILQGQLSKFPFDHNEGRFLANADLHDVHLNYNEAWPTLKNINGKIIFANRSMTILADSSEIMQAPVKSIKAVIPDLDIPILTINSFISSDSVIGLKFIKSSPLKDTIAAKLQAIKLNGSMQLFLNMIIPLSPMAPQKDTKVDGRIVLHNNNLLFGDLNLNLNNLQGELHFTENDLTAEKLDGDLFGRPVQLKIKTKNTDKNDTVNQIDLFGSATVKNIEQAFAIKLSPYLAGGFEYKGLLELHSAKKENVFKLDSNLRGVAVDLPEPFAKAATGDGKLDFKYYFGSNKIPRIVVNYNNKIHAMLALTKTADKPLVVAGEINFGTTLSNMPISSGIVISGKLKKLDWLQWRDYLSKFANNFAKTGGSIIKRISLTVDKLHVLGQIFSEVRLNANPKNTGWEVMLVTPTIQGTLFFPGDKAESQIQGVFQKLYIDLDKQQQNLTKLEPQNLLPLHFIINDFRFDDKVFNKVELITERKVRGIRINKITIATPKFSLVANGDWSVIGNEQQTVLHGKIGSNDIGGFLKQLNLTNNLIGGSGIASFALQWSGAPYKPSLAGVDGNFIVSANNGRIVNLDKKTERKLGIGRILNLLSLRHLSLDFGDLTKKGFIVDKMTGDFELDSGNAFAKSIKLDGPAAQVDAHGRIGLVAQNYDMVLKITPHITSSVPVVAAIATANPIVGLVSWFVADKIIAPGIKKVTTHTYHVVGSWDEPILKKN